MLKRNKRDNESFVREKTLETMKTNTFLKPSDIVLIAKGDKAYCFYEIVESSSNENKVQLTNGLYAVLIDDPIRFTKEEIENKFIENNKTIQSSIDLKEDKTSAENTKNEINSSLNTKFDKASTLTLGSGLSGSSDFNSNVNINLDCLTAEDVDVLLAKYKRGVE